MKKIMILTILGAILTTGCTVTHRKATLNDVMQSWVGSSESKLVASWGAPNSSYQSRDGSSVLTWKSYAEIGYQYGTCEKTFTTDAKGIITGWRYDFCHYYTGGEAIPVDVPVPQPTL